MTDKLDKPKNEQRTIMLPSLLAEEINRIAKQEDRSFSYICSELMREGLITSIFTKENK